MLKNVTLKKVKLHEELSEETPCFTADLYENGKLIAHVSNRGHGGCNDIHPAKGLKYQDVAHLDNIDAECDIMTMVEEINLVKKHQSKAFVLKKDNKTYTQGYMKSFAQIKKESPTRYAMWLEGQKRKLTQEGYEILNTNL